MLIDNKGNVKLIGSGSPTTVNDPYLICNVSIGSNKYTIIKAPKENVVLSDGEEASPIITNDGYNYYILVNVNNLCIASSIYQCKSKSEETRFVEW